MLRTLPPTRLAEVEDFIDFLKAREERTRDEAAQRLGEAFGKLDALNAPAMTSEEVQAEIDVARAERRARADRRRYEHRLFGTAAAEFMEDNARLAETVVPASLAEPVS
jgi:hypothetical protein